MDARESIRHYAGHLYEQERGSSERGAQGEADKKKNAQNPNFPCFLACLPASLPACLYSHAYLPACLRSTARHLPGSFDGTFVYEAI